ncbi:P-type ATPase (P-ATPase) Superfamily, partial [Phytophthora palmivora]
MERAFDRAGLLSEVDEVTLKVLIMDKEGPLSRFVRSLLIAQYKNPSPGDLVMVSEDWVVPCNMAIVKGTTMCDESMLTEISIPECSAELYDPEKGSKKHTLFAGTRVLSSGCNKEILAIVQTTGAHTTKGQLIQSILFPIPMRFKYIEHLKMLVAILFVYTFIVCSISTYFVMSNHMINNQYATFFTSIFMLSAVVSPLLPVVITVGQVNASQRLEKQGVFSTSSVSPFVARWAFSASTRPARYICIVSTFSVYSLLKQLLIVNDVKDAPSFAELLYALTTSCHSVDLLKDFLVGNEVEVRMFTATGWEL